jgi:hypothetical protein
MGRPKGSKNKIRAPRPQPRLQALADELDRRRRELARLQWWTANRPPSDNPGPAPGTVGEAATG